MHSPELVRKAQGGTGWLLLLKSKQVDKKFSLSTRQVSTANRMHSSADTGR
jgi:glycine cleavage system H lipoate-binding protein